MNNTTVVLPGTVNVVLLFIYVNLFTECPSLSVPPFASANDTAVTPGTVVKLSCSVGYTLFGPGVLTCQKSGSWNNELPTCYKGETIQLIYTKVSEYDLKIPQSHTADQSTSP